MFWREPLFPPEMDGKGEYISPQICNRMKRDCLGRTKCSSILVLKGDSKPKRVFRSHRGRQTSDWNASGAMTTKNSKSRGNRVLSSSPRAIDQQQSAPFSVPRHHMVVSIFTPFRARRDILSALPVYGCGARKLLGSYRPVQFTAWL